MIAEGACPRSHEPVNVVAAFVILTDCLCLCAEAVPLHGPQHSRYQKSCRRLFLCGRARMPIRAVNGVPPGNPKQSRKQAKPAELGMALRGGRMVL